MHLAKRLGLFAAAAILASSPNAHANPTSINILTGGIGSSAYQSGTIPGGTYKGQANDVTTATITNVLVSQTSVSDAVAYQMTKLLFENLDRLADAHPAAKDIRLERATSGLPIPLHPGAERFYREVDVLM